MIAFQSASSRSSVGTRLVRPAQLTMMSTLPNAATVAASRAFERGAVGDVGWDAQRAAAQLLRCRPPPRRPARRGAAVATTSAPACARPCASARPMPDVPPMTTAARPVKIERCIGHGAIYAGVGRRRAAWDRRRAAGRVHARPTLRSWRGATWPAVVPLIEGCRFRHARGQRAHRRAPFAAADPSRACACCARDRCSLIAARARLASCARMAW